MKVHILRVSKRRDKPGQKIYDTIQSISSAFPVIFRWRKKLSLEVSSINLMWYKNIMLTKKYAILLKSDIEIIHFFIHLFLTNLSQKHKIICLNKMKLGANFKNIFLNPKSNFTICEKNQQQLKLVLKSYCFFICLIFRFLGVLPNAL